MKRNNKLVQTTGIWKKVQCFHSQFTKFLKTLTTFLRNFAPNTGQSELDYLGNFFQKVGKLGVEINQLDLGSWTEYEDLVPAKVHKRQCLDTKLVHLDR